MIQILNRGTQVGAEPCAEQAVGAVGMLHTMEVQQG
jgi:hypothetical protein